MHQAEYAMGLCLIQMHVVLCDGSRRVTDNPTKSYHTYQKKQFIDVSFEGIFNIGICTFIPMHGNIGPNYMVDGLKLV